MFTFLLNSCLLLSVGGFLNLLVLILLLFFPLEFNPTQPRTFLALWLLHKWRNRGVLPISDSASEQKPRQHLQLQAREQSGDSAFTEPLME
jgi:hypothetical protein